MSEEHATYDIERSDLSWDEFITAYNELSTPKQPDPGIHKIWHHVGKGSVNTIGKYKDRLKILRKDAIPTFSGKEEDKKLHNSISQASIELYNLLTKAVDEREEALNADIELQRKEIEDELTDLRNKIKQSNDKVREVTEQLDVATTQLKDADEQNNDLTRQFEKVTGELDSAKNINTLLSKENAELKESHRQQLASEQNHTLDAKQQLAKAQDERNAAEKKHVTEMSDLKVTHDKILQEEKHESANMNNYYEQQLMSHREQIQKGDDQLKAINDKLLAQEQVLNTEREASKQLSNELAISLMHNEKLQDKIENLTHSLDAANDTVKEVKDEKDKLLTVMENFKVDSNKRHNAK